MKIEKGLEMLKRKNIELDAEAMKIGTTEINSGKIIVISPTEDASMKIYCPRKVLENIKWNYESRYEIGTLTYFEENTPHVISMHSHHLTFPRNLDFVTLSKDQYNLLMKEIKTRNVRRLSLEQMNPGLDYLSRRYRMN